MLKGDKVHSNFFPIKEYWKDDFVQGTWIIYYKKWIYFLSRVANRKGTRFVRLYTNKEK